MKKTQVYAWHKCFSGGRDSIKDDVRSGRPTTATNEAIAQHVCNVVRDDRQVPKMLSAEQKETRMTLAGDMISMADEDGDFLNKIIAGDETWCYLYDPVPERQSSEWKSKTSPRKQKFPRDTSKGKVMLEVFFDSQGLIHHEFIPEGRTVTKELYVEILRRLQDAVRRKRPEKWVENNWFLMHDNAPAHRAIIVKNFLARHNITALDHPPYSPDLSPPDYFLFPCLKSHLKGRRFNAEEVIANVTRALRRVSQNGFQACFQELYTHWQKYRDVWELKPKLKLLPKRRSFCKVHKVSWNIAIESKGYVKCLFQNCSYLALTVDEMIKHYGICNGGGSNGDFSCPFTCPYCKGCVETAEKLEKHIHISHTNEASESFPSSSYGTERSLSPVEVFEPETQTQGNSSRLQDSFFITLDPSNSSDNEDNHFQFVCVDGIKVEKDVEECPSTQQLPAQSVTKERIQQTVPGTRQEIRESYEVVIEQVEDVADDGTSVSEEQPDVSIQVVKSEVLDDMTDGDSWTTESADTSSQLFSIVPEQSDSDLCIYSDDSQFHQPVSISKPVQEHGSSETGSWIVKTYSRRKSKLQSDELCEPPSRYLSKQTSHISRQM
ncbi:hypothetical protein ANN_06596 [Periplaneta americana]|uniref:C2H2-type domain-containing protein n=1 Tax=Periplaneta americana TaxID=6978 RepID=A0ABQ8TFQ4_PERAM|nr:hypothetical protein ANN_06596 [Periplaneta americana]